jgi:hypothetical protein
MQHLPAQATDWDLLSNIRMQRQHLLDGRVADGVRLVLESRLRRFEVHLTPQALSWCRMSIRQAAA